MIGIRFFLSMWAIGAECAVALDGRALDFQSFTNHPP